MFLDGVGVKCKISEESMVITLSIKSATIANPCNDSNLLTSEKVFSLKLLYSLRYFHLKRRNTNHFRLFFADY